MTLKCSEEILGFKDHHDRCAIMVRGMKSGASILPVYSPLKI